MSIDTVHTNINNVIYDIIDNDILDNNKCEALICHIIELTKKVTACEKEIVHLKQMLVEHKKIETEQKTIQTDNVKPVYNDANEMFLQSNWQEAPTRFYDWIKLIDYDNLAVLTNIVGNIKKCFCHTSKYYTKYANYDALSNMCDIDLPLIIDIIDAVGYNSDTLVNLDGHKYQYSLATVYFFDVYVNITMNNSYDIYTDSMITIYRDGLNKLKQYIGIATKAKAHKHFNALCEMYQNNQGDNKTQILYNKKLAETFKQFAEIFILTETEVFTYT
jgi:hypothetical protein